jgi:hypothetical protein
MSTKAGSASPETTAVGRHRPAVRALCEGVYCILKPESSGGRRRSPQSDTHLVYKLELPTHGAGEPQEAMNVEP